MTHTADIPTLPPTWTTTPSKPNPTKTVAAAAPRLASTMQITVAAAKRNNAMKIVTVRWAVE